MTAVRVRPARTGEAPTLAEIANDLNDHVGVQRRPFTPERVMGVDGERLRRGRRRFVVCRAWPRALDIL